MRKWACLWVFVCACGDVITNADVTVTISPAAPVTTDDLMASASGADGRTLTYRWSASGQPGATGATLPASATTKGEVWTVEAVENDAVVGSAMVTIGDAPPTVTTPTIKGPTWAAAPLVCAATATDPDGDTVTFSFAWQVNGAAYTGMTATTTSTNDTIPKLTTKSGEAYKCIATASSGSTMASADVTVTVTPRVAYTMAEGANAALQTIDLDSGLVTNVGPSGVTYQFGDLAWDRVAQKLYMIDGRPSNALYSINTTTGAATLIGTHGLTDMFALAATPSGLYGVTTGSANTLYKLNPTTGAPTLIGTIAVSGRMEGLVWDTAHNRAIGQNISGVTYVVDLTNATVTSLGGSAPADDFGLTYDPYADRYYRMSYGGQLFVIDPMTFASTSLQTSLTSHTSIALPLPAP